MIQFLSRLAYTPYLPDGTWSSWDGKNFQFTENFDYIDDVFGARRVPKGFVSDGGSIPEPFQNIIKPFGHGLWGFIPHDLEYGLQRFSRSEVDMMLKRILEQTKFNLAGIDVIYDAVRMGGEFAWNNDKKNVESNLKLLEASYHDGSNAAIAS